METAATQTHKKPDADTARMSVAQSGRQEGQEGKPADYIKVQLYLAPKDLVLLEEHRLKLMRQGKDISRSRLIAAAIRRYVADGGQSKTKVRG